MAHSLYVINSRGERELFSCQKIYKSARRVGAGKELARKIVKSIEKEAEPGIKTSKIFKKVKKLLREEIPRAAIRFNLKDGMRKLGPTGFLFEKFIGGILKKLGFETKINQYLPGFCVKNYEIDFLAKKGNLIYIGECKYRNTVGERVHSKDALANYARFLDILNGPYFKSKKYQNFKVKTMMVTNTKFTSRSIDYSRCMSVELLGWKYPKNKGLEHLIEKEKFYPITILPSLRGYLKDILISEKIMLVEDVLKIDSQKLAKKFKIPIKRFYPLIKEAEILLEK
jgi:hypothetical protein